MDDLQDLLRPMQQIKLEIACLALCRRVDIQQEKIKINVQKWWDWDHSFRDWTGQAEAAEPKYVCSKDISEIKRFSKSCLHIFWGCGISSSVSLETRDVFPKAVRIHRSPGKLTKRDCLDIAPLCKQRKECWCTRSVLSDPVNFGVTMMGKLTF